MSQPRLFASDPIHRALRGYPVIDLRALPQGRQIMEHYRQCDERNEAKGVWRLTVGGGTDVGPCGLREVRP